jgi:predicted GTPase
MQYYRTNDLSNNLNIIGINPLDVMVTGVTGAGKSTTLNSFFQREVAKVGTGADPETMELTSYSLNNFFRLWDTPGLGDGIEQDKKHSKRIVDLLYKDYSKGGNQYGFIDMVLIILDGGVRDMGTTYKLLNEVIVPNFQKKRVLIAVNQADMGMKGRYWNYQDNKPEQKLKEFLDEKVLSIKRRVKEATGVEIIKPIYYSAEYNYNIETLFDFIIDNMPTKKRKLKVEQQ